MLGDHITKAMITLRISVDTHTSLDDLLMLERNLKGVRAKHAESYKETDDWVVFWADIEARIAKRKAELA